MFVKICLLIHTYNIYVLVLLNLLTLIHFYLQTLLQKQGNCYILSKLHKLCVLMAYNVFPYP